MVADVGGGECALVLAPGSFGLHDGDGGDQTGDNKHGCAEPPGVQGARCWAFLGVRVLAGTAGRNGRGLGYRSAALRLGVSLCHGWSRAGRGNVTGGGRWGESGGAVRPRLGAKERRCETYADDVG